MSDLELQLAERLLEPSGTALSASGELDVASSERLQKRLQSLARPGTVVVLDISAVTFIDSSGLRVILDCFKSSRRDGWELRVEPEISQTVRRVLELTGIDRVFWPA